MDEAMDGSPVGVIALFFQCFDTVGSVIHGASRPCIAVPLSPNDLYQNSWRQRPRETGWRMAIKAEIVVQVVNSK